MPAILRGNKKHPELRFGYGEIGHTAGAGVADTI
jgi:hypothetical protein